MEEVRKERAIVLLSGGQDSTVSLLWALKHFSEVHALTILYGQSHAVEVEQARKITQLLGVPHHFRDLPPSFFPPSSLTSDPDTIPSGEIPPNWIPPTFVPGRNLVFFTLAALEGYSRQIDHIVSGVCQVDFSNYPDCRDRFLYAMEETLRLAMEKPFQLHSPLLNLSKGEIWKLAEELGGLDLVIEYTHTCYRGDRTKRHEWGYGCGTCPACLLRKKGYDAFRQMKKPI